MKDNRFLELVNVYLDGEISEAETLELEREIRSSAQRMDQYRRYCRMQKACMVLAKQSREEMTMAGQKIVRLPEARSSWLRGQWWRGGFYGGTAAIAATVILVISMSGPAQLAKDPAAPAENARTVKIPLDAFAQPKTLEPKFATLTDRWSTLTRLEGMTIATPEFSGSREPQFTGAPVVPEWSTSILRESGPLEFRYRTDSFSGARVLHGQSRSEDGETEFATFPFAR